MPVASTNANKVRILTEKPMAQMIPNAPASETGILSAGTIVARQEPINTNKVRTTKATVRLNDTTTSFTESRINSASSDVTTIFMSVKRLSKSFTIESTSSEISMVFELACRITPKPITGRPSSRTILLESAGPKYTLATSLIRISPEMTMLPTSSALTDVASARTIKA